MRVLLNRFYEDLQMNFPTPKLAKWMTVAASVIVMAACNSSDTTAPDTSLDAAFDATDPVAVTFNSTFGLPDGPFTDATSMPFMAGLTLPNGVTIQRPIAFGALASAGAQLPDSLKLTTIQKAQIAALVTAFEAANKTDIDIMAAAHVNAKAARQSGASKDSVLAILNAAKPAALRVAANAEALRVSIQGVLTASQKAWIDAHRPTNPFRLP